MNGFPPARRAFTVTLDDFTAKRIREQAERERRRPGDEIAVIVERAIQKPADRGTGPRRD